ncbi:hypothetical protein BDY24DRAFT_396804 [Mrakia frigida]|uniref:RRM and SURP domain-containing protein n=1 Tax=Mrakia frigida TaxID=29902 RepID=UPI003FCC17AD
MQRKQLDLSRFGGGSSDEDESRPQPKALVGEKKQTFAYGINKLSKRDKDQAEAKRKKEEEERQAAIVFAEFSAEFEAEHGEGSSSGPKRGGFVLASGSGSKGGAPTPYEPPRAPSAFNRASKPRSPSPPPSSAPKGKGKRVMDSFLEDLKRDQAARDERFKKSGMSASSASVHAAWENPKDRGSHDMGDSMTSNLYVGNLPPNVSEQPLGLLFAKCGPVGSVKIMYPRLEEPRPNADTSQLGARRVGIRAGLSGFVAYMKRADAERAIKDFDGLDWGGSVLKVGWSKSVPLPQRAIYDITTSANRRSRSRSFSPPPSSKRSRRSASPNNHSRQRSYSRSRSRSRSPPRKKGPNLQPEIEKFIRTVAGKVKDLGPEFENHLREKEKENPKFQFLKDEMLPEFHFFRSLIDPSYRPPPPAPLPFIDEGYNSVYSTDSEEEEERERTRKGALGKLARRRFTSCLRGLKGERGDVARCMTFALEHADAADEVADMILQSLVIFETPVPLKVARLHLVSDILSNSASPMPNAWKYRGAFEARLPAVFDHLGTLYSSFKAQAGRLSAEQFKSHITNVLDVLEIWIVFTPSFTEDLRARLNGTFTSSSSSSSNNASASAQLTPAEEAARAQAAESNHQSRFKKSGFSSSFVSAAPVPVDEDLDGAPMDDGEDLDGEAMEDDLDGSPMR